MNELLPTLSGKELIGLVAVAGAFVCGLLGIAMVMVHRCLDYRQAQTATAIKHDMLNRGMSADEIIAVMEAGSGSPNCISRGLSCRA